jgi:hypothetical protein
VIAALDSSGYYVSRSARGDHMTIDAGPHGFLNGGHAHADALSMTLGVRGRPLLVDPGTGGYTMDSRMRDRFRSSQLHNTLTLDGQSQSSPNGPFHWRTRADARALDWRTDSRFEYFEGCHSGYGADTHHRTVLSRPGVWIVVDRVRGPGRHLAEAHWHLDPAWTTSIARRGIVRAEHTDGAIVWFLCMDADYEVLRGTADGSWLGWYAPAYGRLVPTSTVRSTCRRDAPFAMVTAIVESPDQPALEALPVSSGAGADPGAIAFSLRTAKWNEVLVFGRTIDDSDQSSGRMLRAAGIETTARVLCWREGEDGSSEPVALIDGVAKSAHARIA